MLPKNNITLIGFMGSGKTTIGKKLSNKLNKTFIDLDQCIEKELGDSINNIFETKGEEYFRTMEQTCLKKILKTQSNIVLSVGGGTPCFNDNMSIINQHSTSIFLNINEGMLFSRLKEKKHNRPLIKDLDDFALKRFIHEKLKERNPFYKQAHITIDTKECEIKSILKKLTAFT
jgi:shikimate kinase